MFEWIEMMENPRKTGEYKLISGLILIIFFCKIMFGFRRKNENLIYSLFTKPMKPYVTNLKIDDAKHRTD